MQIARVSFAGASSADRAMLYLEQVVLISVLVAASY